MISYIYQAKHSEPIYAFPFFILCIYTVYNIYFTLTVANEINLPHVWVILVDDDYPVYAHWFTCSQRLSKLLWHSNFWTFSVPDETYSINASCVLN